MNYSTSNNILIPEQNKDIKKHHTATTQRESFRQLNASGQRMKEKLLIYEAIKQYQPATSRMLCEITGIERTNITRSLFDLIHDTQAEIKEAFIAKCPTTKRKVKYYTLINWKKDE